MATHLIGWSTEEYKKWSQDHKESTKTVGLCYQVPDEVRLNYDSGQSPKIVGYASLFDTWYELYQGFRERVAKGAFSKTIQNDDVRALLNHDPNYVLGRNKAGTLELKEDDRGLHYEIIAPDTTFAKDLLVSLKRKDITQSSFGFNIVEQTFAYDKKNGMVSRTLNEVRLFDVSPVTYPASPQTDAHVRMIAGSEDNCSEIVEPKEDISSVELSDDKLDAEWGAIKEAANNRRS